MMSAGHRSSPFVRSLPPLRVAWSSGPAAASSRRLPAPRGFPSVLCLSKIHNATLTIIKKGVNGRQAVRVDFIDIR